MSHVFFLISKKLKRKKHRDTNDDLYIRKFYVVKNIYIYIYIYISIYIHGWDTVTRLQWRGGLGGGREAPPPTRCWVWREAPPQQLVYIFMNDSYNE